MAKWTVIATFQAKGNDPVEQAWQREGDQIGAIMSVSQLFNHDNGEEKGSPFYPKLLSIRIERVDGSEHICSDECDPSNCVVAHGLEFGYNATD